MVSIQLDAAHEKRLDELAKGRGQDAADLASHIVVEYLDFQTLPTDSDQQWGEASVALTPEIMDQASAFFPRAHRKEL